MIDSWLMFEAAAWQHVLWTLGHTLWQAPTVAFLLFTLLRIVPARLSGPRYAASLTALGFVVLTSLTTYATLAYPWPPSDTKPTADAAAPAIQTSTPATPPMDFQPTAEDTISFDLGAWTPALVILWLAGVSFMTVRMSVTLCSVQRFRREPSLPPGELLDRIVALQQRMRIRRPVKVVVSETLASPAVFGFWAPVLILPVSVATGIPIHEVEAVILHELAHVRRHDYIVELMQMLIEALLYFNPAVWWISRQIRQEREACADAAAVALTGEPVHFARILAEWAERISKAPSLPAPASVASFASRKHHLVDRVRRLLKPDHLPEMSLSPLAMTPLLLSGLLLLAGMYQGASVAVALVAEALSPTQRVERIAKVRETFDVIPTTSTGKDVTLKGMIQTFDGRPVPAKTSLHAVSVVKNSTHSISLGTTSSTFEKNVPYGAIYVRVESEGYAPTFAGPFLPEANQPVLDVGTITLTQGFIGRVRVRSKDGKPIAHAELSGNIPMRGGYPVHTWKTDDEGLAVFTNAADGGYSFTVVAPGYQWQRFEHVQLRPGEPTELTLAVAKPTTGTVVDQNGQPLANAEIRQYARYSSGPYSGGSYVDGERGRVLAHTNDSGRFVLDTLADDWQYCLLVSGGGHRFLQMDVVAGQELVLQVPEERVLRGKILGDLGRLEIEDGKPVVRCSQTTRFGDHRSHRQSNTAPVTVAENAPDVGRFEIKDHLATEVTITAGSKSTTVDLSKPVEELVIDLRDEPIPPATRTVVIRFEPQEPGAAAPNGTVRCYSRSIVAPKGDAFAIQDGRLELVVQTPAKLHFADQQIPGYILESSSIEVEAGTGTQTETIPLLPAGGIYGSIDGETSGFDVTVAAVFAGGSEELRSKFSLPSGVRVDESGKFFLSPLPLGGTFAVKAGRGQYIEISDPIPLTPDRPTARIDLSMGPGVVCSGRVVDAEGRPVAGAPVMLSFKHPFTSVRFGPPNETDADGMFHLSDLNPRVGQYSVLLDFDKDYVAKQAELSMTGQPIEIQVERGQVIEGVVLDDATGRPIAGVEVLAMPQAFGKAYRRYNAEGRTDQSGRFRFSTLPDQPMRLIAPTLRLTGPADVYTYPPGTKDATLRGSLASRATDVSSAP